MAGVVGAFWSPAAAYADHLPCALGPLCSVLPVLPELDHDVDLTTDPNGLAGQPGFAPPTMPGE